MLGFMQKTLDMKGSTMMKEERILVYTACKRVLEPDFRLMLTLKTLETFGKFEPQKEFLDEYRKMACKRIDEKCSNVVRIIQENIIDSVTEKGDDEQQAFFYKMKADYLRYICMYPKSEERLLECKEEALKAYQKANKFKLHPGSPTRLGLVLNFAIFKAEIMGDYGLAIKMAEKGQADSIDKTEEMNDEDYRESKDLLDLYRENIQVWTAVIHAEKENV